MRTILLSITTLIGLGWFGPSMVRADDWWRDRWFRPPYAYRFGSTPYDRFEYRVPQMERNYYTPPHFAPDSPPAYGYVPYNSFNYRLPQPLPSYGYRR